MVSCVKKNEKEEEELKSLGDTEKVYASKN